MAVVYRRNAKHEVVTLLEDHQLTAITALEDAVIHVDCRLHFVATDSTHIHILVSWSGDRTWVAIRTSLKRAVTIALKDRFGGRPWLTDGASRKRVRDRKHFNHLVDKYLTSHKGWKWDERRGLFK